MDKNIRLDRQQRRAVADTTGYRAVIAGAGSGKTRVFAAAVKEVLERGANPYGVLCVTFTNKAADEMRSRLKDYGCKDVERLWLGTFHSMCAKLLREHGTTIGISPEFSIYSARDAWRVLRESIRNLGYTGRDMNVVQMSMRISAFKSRQQDLDEYMLECVEPLQRTQFRKILTEYSRILKRNNALDFDDLIYKVAELVPVTEPVKISELFDYVFVDEYQDTSSLEAQILDGLASGSGNLMVVGDARQSIYGWRGCEPTNLTDFCSNHKRGKEYVIATNYRSHRDIVDHSMRVLIGSGAHQETPCRAAARKRGQVSYLAYKNSATELEFTVRQIEALAKCGNYVYNDIAVLTRTRRLLIPFEQALSELGIPHRCEASVYKDSKQVARIAVSYLKLYINASDTSAMAELSSLLHSNRQAKRAISASIWEPATIGLRKGASRTPSGAPGVMQSALFVIKEIKRRRPTTLLDLLYCLWELDPRTADDADSVSLLYEAAAHDLRPVHQALPELLTRIVEDGLESRVTSVSDGVVLSTIHKAKGLEYPVVFLPHLNDGVIPHTNSISEGSTDEERRILYVAMTRAIELLVLSYTKEVTVRGRTYHQQPTRFIDKCRFR